MIYKINGDAGTGKTHSLVSLIKQLTSNNKSFCVITPTNKAAKVLNSRFENEGLQVTAKTLHKTLYKWEKTETISGYKEEPILDPLTNKFVRDPKTGNIETRKIPVYVWKRVFSPPRVNAILVDEASMVGSGVWRDLSALNCDIHAFGDEKQLPPIEEYKKLETTAQPFYKYWHNMPASQTLTTQHRQSGDLSTFIDDIKRALFPTNHFLQSAIPCPHSQGDNFSEHANNLSEADLLEMMMMADIVITPYNKTRALVNTIIRKQRAKIEGKPYSVIPVPGDKLIFTSALKKERPDPAYPFRVIREIILAKNEIVTVTNVFDYNKQAGVIVAEFVDDLGQSRTELLDVSKLVGAGSTGSFDTPSVDYAYAVTAHSAQGAQWDNVLFLDSGSFPNDLEKLRYVAITRASKRLHIVCGITNTDDENRNIIARIFKTI